MSKEKKKIINIYLTKKEFKLVNELKYKYHVSISSISTIVLTILLPEIRETLKTEYLYKEHGNKTSIKPRLQYESIEKINWSLLHNNALKIFLNKDLEKYVDKEKANKLNSKIYNEFQNTYEENWNGNTMSRFIPKFIKQNREYVKKVLEVE